VQDRANSVRPHRTSTRLSFMCKAVAAYLFAGGPAPAAESTPYDTGWWAQAVFGEQQVKVAVDQKDHQRAVLVARFLWYFTDHELSKRQKPSEPCFHAAMHLRVVAGSISEALASDSHKIFPIDPASSRSLLDVLDDSYADFAKDIRNCEGLIRVDATPRAWTGRPSEGLR
jgi:hypothetical protein